MVMPVRLAQPEPPPGERSMLVVSDRQVACEVGGEAVVLQLDQGVYYGLNPVGARVWQLLQQPRLLADVVERLVDEFDVSHDQCLRDVRELVADLCRHRLVEVRETSEA